MITLHIAPSEARDVRIDLEEYLRRPEQGALYRNILESIEKPLIEYILDRTGGNQLKAARMLGINRNTMRAKIKKLAIDIGRWKV